MRSARALVPLLLLGLLPEPATLRADAALPAGAVAAAETVLPRPAVNLFADLLGKTETEIDARLATAWRHFFAGDPATERLFFPVGADQAYIADTGNEDVRSEGMSYGMMIAVQLDKREEFDRLWRWAKAHMRHADGPRRGYFAWQCRFDGRVIDPGSASDGEEWFAMALLFAAHRWPADAPFPPGRARPPAEPGIRGGDAARPEASPYPPPHPPPAPIDYAAEAQELLREMRLKPATREVTAIFDRERRQVVFAPTPEASRLTDPSYHLPAFYELWARWDRDPAGRAFWAACAAESRVFFRRAAHPQTGLMPEYAHFDGTPFTATTFGEGKSDFRFDAWRTLANVALDHAWWRADPWQRSQSDRVLRFLAAHRPRIPNQFTLDGRPLSTDTSSGLEAMAAVAGLAADPELARPFVQALWDAPLAAGRWRYYNGLLQMLALLQVSGRFQIHAPPP